jgi:hypothetical protein
MGLGAIRSLPHIERDPPEEENHSGPPPPQLKADQSVGSKIHLGLLIYMPASESQIYARCL